MRRSQSDRDAAAARFVLADAVRLAEALERMARARGEPLSAADVSDLRSAADLIRATYPQPANGNYP